MTKAIVAKDHVHLFVGYPPQLAVSKLVQRLKGKSSSILLGEYTELRRKRLVADLSIQNQMLKEVNARKW